ncbi:hypothetical protein [Actinomyces slackii]|nr:hypothetical protein [Actinomyces slackii]
MGTPMGLVKRTRSGLASAASTVAGAARAPARKAVPTGPTPTEPLRGTALERRLRTALSTAPHARSTASQVMSASPLRRGLFNVGLKQAARLRREGYLPASAGLEREELVRIHGAIIPTIADGTFRRPSRSRPDKAMTSSHGRTTGELHEIDVPQEQAALGALGWTRLCVDTDEIRARRVLSIIHSYHLDVLISPLGPSPSEYAADMRLLLPRGLSPQIQEALHQSSRPTLRLHLLGEGRIAVDDGSLLVRTFPDCPHPWPGSLLVEGGRVTRAEIEIHRHPNVMANILDVVDP